MSMDMIRKLDVKDRIILMNDIWESLESEGSSIESPSWHKDILEERVEKIKNAKVNFISLEKLKTI